MDAGFIGGPLAALTGTLESWPQSDAQADTQSAPQSQHHTAAAAGT